MRVSRRGVAIGGAGGAIVIVVVLVARAFGYDLTGLLGSGGGNSSSQTQTQTQQDQNQTAPLDPKNDPNAELADFVVFAFNDVQATFAKQLAEQHPYNGAPYRKAKLVLFTDLVDTGCGQSEAAIGPFYCPPDEKAYIDLTFYALLKDKLGADGNFAQAYVIAHELGHHLQTIFGIDEMVRKKGLAGQREGASSLSVRQELQADCFAGVWGHSAKDRNLLEIGDIEKALNAASAIGDDRLQKMSGRKVNPETWTHGSSAMRVKWFRAGFDTGKFSACDTFSAESP
jgi:predicted metalloprotease